VSRRYPGAYDPSTDAGLALWLDGRDSTSASLLDTGGGAIANGATIGTWKSKKGTTRSFTQWGTNARPTWDSTGINGFAAVRSNSQILTTQTTMSDFASMSGLTVSCVVKRNGSLGGQGPAFSMTMTGPGNSDNSMVQVQSRDTFFVGGRRINTDGFQSVSGASTPSIYVITGVFDYANALGSEYANGVKDTIGATYQTAGTSATPFALSVGAFAQQSGNAMSSPAADCWIGEVLVTLSALTADQLLTRHHYLCTRWGV
jgi:hypothetical protein